MKRKYGWRPDLPDRRDHMFAAVRRVVGHLPVRVDLRLGCSRVEDQGQIGSCTANALVSCLEFLEIAATKKWVDLSRLYLYYKERELENAVDIDQGAYIRDGIKVLAKIGTPHESEWPYVEANWRKKPTPGADRAAKQHTIADYQRLDTLNDMKACLAAGFPFVFGFSVYESFESEEVGKTGDVPMPSRRERVLGGHAVTGVGYDDTKGHLIVRNSWGIGWGDKGYCYMPYAMVSDRNMSDDFWTLRKVVNLEQ